MAKSARSPASSRSCCRKPSKRRLRSFAFSPTTMATLAAFAVSEWKVIVDPQVGIGAELDIADTLRGGHVVWSDPLISAETRVVKGMLEEGGRGSCGFGACRRRAAVTIGFHEDRAAQISALEWIDSEPANGAVDVSRGHYRRLDRDAAWSLDKDRRMEARRRQAFDQEVR